MLHQYVYHRFLEGSGKICAVDLLPFHLGIVDIVQNCRLHAAEAEIVWAVPQLSFWENNGIWISLTGQFIHLRSSRITKSNGTGNLVKGLSRCIIPGASQNLKLAVVLYDYKMGMSARYDQAQKRRFQVRMLNIVGGNVSLDVMNAYKGKLLCICNCLGLCYAYKKGTYKSGTVGNTDCIQIIQGDTRLFQCLLDHLVYFLNMLA